MNPAKRQPKVEPDEVSVATEGNADRQAGLPRSNYSVDYVPVIAAMSMQQIDGILSKMPTSPRRGS